MLVSAGFVPFSPPVLGLRLRLLCVVGEVYVVRLDFEGGTQVEEVGLYGRRGSGILLSCVRWLGFECILVV